MNNIVTRSILPAGLVVLGAMALSPVAQAQVMVVTQGENFTVHYEPNYEGNVVGGGRLQVGTKNDPRRYLDEAYSKAAPGTPVDLGGQNGVAYLSPAQAPAATRAIGERPDQAVSTPG